MPWKSATRAILAAFGVSFLGLSGTAQAQAWPAKPIRTLQTLGTGGGAEPLARLVATRLSEVLGQPVLVEPQGGAGGAIGVAMTARAAPDGYTLALASVSSVVMRRLLVKNVPYDSLKDFTPVILLGETVSCVIASPSQPYTTLPEAIEYARRNPGKLVYGSSGVGTTHHLSGVMLEQVTGTHMLHVPYKGGGESLTGLLGGQVGMVYGIVGTVASQIKSGKVRLLAINAGKRFSRLPEVPTIGELVKGYDRPPSWNGYLGPAGLPPAITRRLYEEINRIATSADAQEKLLDLGFVVDTAGPEDFAAYIRTSLDNFGRAVRAAKIEPE